MRQCVKRVVSNHEDMRHATKPTPDLSVEVCSAPYFSENYSLAEKMRYIHQAAYIVYLRYAKSA
jgi:hypothetical protein